MIITLETTLGDLERALMGGRSLHVSRQLNGDWRAMIVGSSLEPPLADGHGPTWYEAMKACFAAYESADPFANDANGD